MIYLNYTYAYKLPIYKLDEEGLSDLIPGAAVIIIQMDSGLAGFFSSDSAQPMMWAIGRISYSLKVVFCYSLSLSSWCRIIRLH